MNSIYYWTGFALIWVLLICISAYLIYLISYVIYGFVKHKIYQSDWYAFHIRKKTLDTGLMRKFYHKTTGKAKYWMLMFRLRNIKRSKKVNL